MRIQKTMTLMLGGTSLTAGRLCNPPLPWTRYLYEDMIAAQECQGPVRIINTGKGSQTSNFGASQAILMAPLRPSHVLMEDFGINDCAIGPVSIPQATINFNSMVASYRAARSDVVIVHQTMSPASAGDTFRTNLAAYYTNGLANAALNGLESLDNYNGTILVPGGWPKPLDPAITVGAAPFAFPIPSGFAGWGLAVTWNPADKNANVILLNGDISATVVGATDCAQRATSGLSAGKLYFEVTLSVAAAGVVGIMTAAGSIANGDFVGETAGGYGYATGGGLYAGSGSPFATVATYTVGDVIGVAVDFTNLKIWWSKNGVWQNGDPATNTSGRAISAGTYFPAASEASNSVMTGKFTNLGDGLHPLWVPTAFKQYSYPNILAWAKRAMADYW